MTDIIKHSSLISLLKESPIMSCSTTTYYRDLIICIEDKLRELNFKSIIKFRHSTPRSVERMDEW